MKVCVLLYVLIIISFGMDELVDFEVLKEVGVFVFIDDGVGV